MGDDATLHSSSYSRGMFVFIRVHLCLFVANFALLRCSILGMGLFGNRRDDATMHPSAQGETAPTRIEEIWLWSVFMR